MQITDSEVMRAPRLVRKNRAHQLVSLWVLAIISSGIGAALVWSGYEIEGGAIAVLAFAPLFWRLDRLWFPRLFAGPFIMMYLFHGLGYGVGPLWETSVIGRLSAIKEGLAPAQWGGALGLATIALVFPRALERASGRKSRSIRFRDHSGEGAGWNRYSLLLLAFSALVLAYGYRTGVMNRLNPRDVSLLQSSAISAFQSTHQVMFFFLGLSAARSRKLWRIVWAAAFLAYATFFFLDGGRGTVAIALIVSLIGFVWGGASFRFASVTLLIFTVIFIPLSGVVRLYRDAYTVNTEADRSAGFARAFDDFWASRESIADATEAFAWSLTAKSVDAIFISTPEFIPYIGFAELQPALYSVIPQVIKPDRADPMEGNTLAIRYGAARLDSKGSYMPTVGDGYRRFGWLGIVFVYALLSLVYGFAVGFCWARQSRCEYMAMFIFLLIQLPGIWSSSLVGLIYTVSWILPKYFAFFWLTRRLQQLLFGKPKPVLSVRPAIQMNVA